MHTQTEKAEKADKRKGDSGLVVSVTLLWTKLRVWQIGKANNKVRVSIVRRKFH